MKKILNINSTRLADSTAIEKIGIAGVILMENAARSCADYIKPQIKCGADILILCGVGNNGGDGFALARHLDDYNIRIAFIGNPDKMSPETKSNYMALVNLNFDITHLTEECQIESFNFNADCIVDALIGVGGTENLKGLVVNVLDKANQIDCFKIAIDCPSGLNADTGIAHKSAFKSMLTVTMFAMKPGLILNDGIYTSGKIEIAFLGAPDSIIDNIANDFIIEDKDIPKILPGRNPRSSKFDYGKVLIIAGSKEYPGAGALAANACIKSGAGLVYLACEKIHPALLPEIIPLELEFSLDNSEFLIEKAKTMDAVIIGPGLGNSQNSIDFAKSIIEKIKDIPLLIDADAITALDKSSKLTKNVIITPHIGEFSRLIGMDRAQASLMSYQLAKEWAEKLNCIVLLKGVPTIISDGYQSYFNTNGNPGMASAGSGDVLSGIIGSLCAQKISPLNSAALGAYLHAKAADNYVANRDMLTLSASSIIDETEKIFQ